MYSDRMASLKKTPWWLPLVGSVGFGLMGAFAATFFPKWVQAVLFGLGALCVLWSLGALGVRYHLRRRLERQVPPTVYLRNTGAISVFGDKMWGIKWIEATLNLTFRGEGANLMDDTPVKEKNISFELFNAGDEPVRHVVVRWHLPAVDMSEMVKVLGTPLREFDGDILKLSANGNGSIHPIRTEIADPPIEVIDGRGKLEIAAHRAFTEAFSICALARAREHHEKVVLPAVSSVPEGGDPMDHLVKWKRPMDRFFIELSYFKNERQCRHSFEVLSYVWGGGQPYAHEPTEETPNLYVPKPGAVAVVDHVTVRHYEERS